MGKVLAAYELGLFAVLVRYDQVYEERYGYYDPAAAGALGHARQRIGQAIRALKHEFGRRVAVARMNRIVGQIMAEPGLDPNLVRDRWDRLETLATNAMRNHPRFHGWVELGLALGHCVLDTLDDATRLALPSMTRIARAMTLLPPSRIETTPVLKKMAATTELPESQSALHVLCGFLDDPPPGEFELIAPEAAVIRKLDSLVQRVGQQLAVVPDRELDVFLEPDHIQVVLDGRAYEIGHVQALILRVLRSFDGNVVKPQNWAECEPSLAPVEVHKQIRTLPRRIRELVKTKVGRGGGRWLDLS